MAIRAGLVAPAVAIATAAAAADGEKIFRKAFTGCLSIKRENIRGQIPPGSDLGGVGARIDATILWAILRGDKTSTKRHEPFKGTDAESQALIDWALELKRRPITRLCLSSGQDAG